MKVLSLFSGCGGMDLGMSGGFSYLGKDYERHPFDIVFAQDFDPNCTRIYNGNFEKHSIVGDVRDIIIDSLPQFDILIGGFPCQSFSIVAQNPPRLGCKDEDKGLLYREMVRILAERQPRFFIAENVKGLLSANKKQAFKLIIKEFSEAGYHLRYKVLNAADYGVPQKRERVIIIGFRRYKDFNNFSFPTPVDSTEKKVLGDVISEAANKSERLYFSEKAVEGMLKQRNRMSKGRVQVLSEPCNTVSAHLAKVSLNSFDPVIQVNGRYRRFSTEEAAGIQSFPDSFDFKMVSEPCQYRAIGNAVPPVMMWHIANALKRTISKRAAYKTIVTPLYKEITFTEEGYLINEDILNLELNKK